MYTFVIHQCMQHAKHAERHIRVCKRAYGTLCHADQSTFLALLPPLPPCLPLPPLPWPCAELEPAWTARYEKPFRLVSAVCSITVL